MDFSGFGMMFISCCFVTVIPPIIAGILWVIIYAVRKAQGLNLDKTKGITLFLIVYVLSVIASCIFIYFSYLQYMYVM
jgi:hypothetical protein